MNERGKKQKEKIPKREGRREWIFMWKRGMSVTKTTLLSPDPFGLPSLFSFCFSIFLLSTTPQPFPLPIPSPSLTLVVSILFYFFQHQFKLFILRGFLSDISILRINVTVYMRLGKQNVDYMTTKNQHLQHIWYGVR